MLIDDVLRDYVRDLQRFPEIDRAMRDWERLRPLVEEANRALAMHKQFEHELRLLHDSTVASQVALARQLRDAYGSFGGVAEILRAHNAAKEQFAMVSSVSASMTEQYRYIRDALGSQQSLWDDGLRAWRGTGLGDSLADWYRTVRVPSVIAMSGALDLSMDIARLLERDAPGEVDDGTVPDDLGNELAEHFHKETVEETLADIKATVEKVLAGQHSSMSSKLLKFVLHAVLGIGLHLAATTIHENYLGTRGTVDKQVHKEVKALVQIMDEIPQESRVVTATQLNVRTAPSTKARAIGRLYARDCVILLERRRSWSRVEYRNNDGQLIIAGWVFSRYLIPAAR